MFDDLDDPNPPTAGMHTLANVTQRARRIRRRRAMWVGAGAGALVVAATIGTLAATDDGTSGGGKIVNLSPDSTTTGSTDATVLPSSTVSATGDPETTLGPPPSASSTATSTSSAPTDVTTPSNVTTPGGGSSIDDGSSTATTAATSNTSNTSNTATTATTSTTATTATTAVSPAVRPIVAIDANGDALIVRKDGTRTLLYDGPGLDDPPPDEGETIVIDAVAVTDDQSFAFVGTCCEPVPGTILRFALPDTSTFQTAFGHAPAISPDGSKVASDVLGMVSVSDLALTPIASTADDFLGDASGIGIVWIDQRRFVVLTALPDTTGLQSLTLTTNNTLQAGPSRSIDDVDGFAATLGGIGDGVIYVAGLTDATLTAFDSNTLQPVPARNVTLPGDALSAWMQGGELRWIDQDQRLHIGDTIVPGEFIWVR